MDAKQIILTARAQSMAFAVSEMQKYDTTVRPAGDLGAGVKLLSLPGGWARFIQDAPPLIFARHIFPVQWQSETAEAGEILQGVTIPPAGALFSVQARGAFPMLQELEEALAERGCIKNNKFPAWVLSLYASGDMYYAGVSEVQHNRSRWNGGAVRYANEGTISRAEHKLTEAFETFGLTFAKQVPLRALDLGAAPGGWSKVLLEAGAHVTAVDPGPLDTRIGSHPALRYVCATAQRYFAGAGRETLFDIIVNDMKMDMYDSARIMCDAAAFLTPGGYGVMTLKLKAGHNLAKINKALALLEKKYRVTHTRQLFYNRDEVTVCLVRG